MNVGLVTVREGGHGGHLIGQLVRHRFNQGNNLLRLTEPVLHFSCIFVLFCFCFVFAACVFAACVFAACVFFLIFFGFVFPFFGV